METRSWLKLTKIVKLIVKMSYHQERKLESYNEGNLNCSKKDIGANFAPQFLKSSSHVENLTMKLNTYL